MPEALALQYGLDWLTEANAFWAWLEDGLAAFAKAEVTDNAVQELVASQREKIEEFAGQMSDPEAARLTLVAALAVVGVHYASNQKLLAALKEQGVFGPTRG
jgi:hypothetical protein